MDKHFINGGVSGEGTHIKGISIEVGNNKCIGVPEEDIGIMCGGTTIAKRGGTRHVNPWAGGGGGEPPEGIVYERNMFSNSEG